MSTSSASSFSQSSSSRTASPSMFVRMPRTRGVRRRRDDSTAVEIEELDSCTMRQNSYNYFQQTPSLLKSASTFHSSLGRNAPSRKRQRTLAEQLDELCLQVDDKNKGRSRSKRLARDKAKQDAKIVELDEYGHEKAPSLDSSDSESDGMMDISSEQGGLKVYGDVGGTEGIRSFFAAGAAERHRPMDKMYRHYVAVAAQKVAAVTIPQGNELVVFRPPAPVATEFADDLPAYLSLTPHEFEKLTMAEKRQWYQAHSRYMRELDHAEQKGKETEVPLEAKATDSYEPNRRRSSSATSSRSYQVFGVPSMDVEDEKGFDDFGEDVEMMEDIDDDAAPKCPHAAGALTHTEWFTDDEL